MNFDLFENINFQNLERLYVLSLEGRDTSDIKMNYLRDHTHVRENLNFLFENGIFENDGDKVKVSKDKTKSFKEILINEIFRKNNIYFVLLKQYLQNFTLDKDNKFKFKPDKYFNYQTSDMRNFLISIGIIKNENDEYIILNKEILDKIKKQKKSPLKLKEELRSKEQLGLDAEKLVYENEVSKVKKMDKTLKVIHISLEDVSAGYDIQSYNENREKIYIEVKAVSKTNYQFHLSPNEYNISKLYNHNYYLYLLPVDLSNSKKFDYDKILMINNIKDNLIDNSNIWKTENDGFLISKKNN